MNRLRLLVSLPCLATLLSSCSTNGGSPSPWSTAKADYSSSRTAAVAPAAEARPGLGTGWGREAQSEVTGTYFDRASSRPLDVSSVHYNDEAGALAMCRGESYFRTNSIRTVANGMAELRVTSAGGRTLPAYACGDRLICVGESGERYNLKVTNRSDRRLELVLTVDGLDVLDGRPGAFSKRGYILDPGDSYEIEGWRMSDSKVATFRFSSVGDSYANKKHGDTRNVGVIGMAVFAESGPKPHPYSDDSPRRRKADPFPGGRYASPPP